MFELNASFRRKDTEVNTTPCVVEKVIKLSGAEFDRFSRGLMREWGFIRDNQFDRSVDEQGRHRCLLVTGEGRRDGILVSSEGANYARYSSFIPNAEDILNVRRYKALTDLNNKLTAIADHIVMPPTGAGKQYAVDLNDVETIFGVDLLYNDTLMDTVQAMVVERPEVFDLELDKNELIIYRNTDGMEHSAGRGRCGEKPSVMEQIKASRQSPADPVDGGAQKHRKDRGAPEL